VNAAARDMRTLYDVVDATVVASQIRESAECVLAVSLAREGVEATPEQIRRLARELGNNCAQTVCALEIK
jgi:hypothetical protein